MAILENKVFLSSHMTYMTVHGSSILEQERLSLFEEEKKLFCLLPIDSWPSEKQTKTEQN